MPHRPRSPRSDDGAEAQRLIDGWRSLVLSAESGPAPYLTCCPACDGDMAYGARDELETLIRRGGRRGRRIAREVARLDQRFLRATTPNPFVAPGAVWWRGRNLD